MTQRDPFLLWVSCVSVHDYATTSPDDPLPRGGDIVWACTVSADKPFLASLFRRVNTAPAVDELFGQVCEIIGTESANTVVAQP